MAGQGRCAGCGRTGAACTIDRHTLGCTKFQELYQANPKAALSSRDEYQRWKREDKAGGRLQRRDVALVATRKLRSEQATRFARLPDILEDE
jgi:hypothetical protein